MQIPVDCYCDDMPDTPHHHLQTNEVSSDVRPHPIKLKPGEIWGRAEEFYDLMNMRLERQDMPLLSWGHHYGRIYGKRLIQLQLIINAMVQNPDKDMIAASVTKEYREELIQLADSVGIVLEVGPVESFGHNAYKFKIISFKHKEQ